MWTARAAVLRHVGAPMTIETLQVGPLAAGDVLVRIRAASLCHTDLEAIEGALAVQLPAVLGHEAAGEVAAVGAKCGVARRLRGRRRRGTARGRFGAARR
ncbi:MAG: alcohol dehydrogenase catalytic domain-containing protein, partial [Acetobacteraceae bacterium]